jgi:division protein CdvB (Snf7/Vps24/ESCRT-III family)
LSGILSDAGQMNPSDINFEAANEEANKILAEASAVAERTVRRKFPDTPVPDDISDLEKESLS